MRIFILSLVVLGLAACTYPTGPVPTTLLPLASPTAPPTEMPRVLPHAAYFLSERAGPAAVWRLAADAVTLQQVTHLDEAIEEFDVAANGALVYRIQNRIYLHNPQGTPQILVDNASVDASDAAFAYLEAVRNPRLAPNGATLAYAQGGLWLFDVASGNALRVLENSVESEGDKLTPVELYSPVAWAPSGLQLLVSIASPEGSSLGIWDASTDSFLRLQGEAVLCCQASWAADSSSVLLASQALGLVEPGLWRFDAASGEPVPLIEVHTGEAYHFVAWPLQLPNGDLQYFYASSVELPDSDLPLYMVRSATDGAGSRSQLRDDAFSIREALWAADGSLALVVQNATGSAGPIVLAHSDGRPLQVLVDFGRELRWGE